MNCRVCYAEIPREKNTTVCSERCEKIHDAINALDRLVTSTNGCDNCWADLHGRCSEACNAEFRKAYAFGRPLWKLVHLAMNPNHPNP